LEGGLDSGCHRVYSSGHAEVVERLVVVSDGVFGVDSGAFGMGERVRKKMNKMVIMTNACK